MGGGTVLRGVARLASSVSPAVRAASSSAASSCSFCKINAPTQTPTAQSVRLHSCVCPTEATSKAGNVNQQGIRSSWELDDWEFAEEEERVDHLVFGSIPSRTEVEEASSELQNALRLGLMAPPDSGVQPSWSLSPETVIHHGDSKESIGAVSTEENEVSTPLPATEMALDWLEPPPIRSHQGIVQTGGRFNVAEAFYQFQHNPEVQGMVVSLATDQAVWDAVLANEKIQEFKRKLQGDKGFFADKDPLFTDSKDEDKTTEHLPNIFTRCRMFCQSKLEDVLDVIRSIINGVSKTADKKIFAEEDGDIFDRTVKSCTMIAFVVVVVVVLKRLVVQAA